MYLKRLTLQNIKCFERCELSFSPGEDGSYAGWHVLLGMNGTGKSTLLQAMALAMLGPISGARLLQQPATWVRTGADYGSIEAELAHNPNLDGVSTGQPRKTPYDTRLFVSGMKPVKPAGLDLVQPQVAQDPKLGKSLNAGPYSGRKGWFSAGYGPFRRLSGGGGEENASILYGGGREARHLTLFRESAALTNGEKWLITLYSQAVDPLLSADQRGLANSQLLLASTTINNMLPSGTQLWALSTAGITFRTRAGASVLLAQLSDGYRSFLALAIDLLRQIMEFAMVAGWTVSEGGSSISTATEGVVLIDEADTHLHPSWQRDIGFRLCQVFPKMQFIVTAHSPFVAQAARPGGLFMVQSDAEGLVTVEPAEESVRGWRADQILLSPLFGLQSTRDPETEALLEEHDRLKSRNDLGPKDQKRLTEITAILSARLTFPGDTYAERERERKMQSFIDARLARLNGDPT